MFMSPDAENEATDEVGEDQTIPFGLRFDSTSTDQEEADSKSSTHHSHSSGDESDFDFFDDLSDLDSKATVRAAASLAAIGLSLLASIVLSS
ncbi:hypothetical protein GGI23_003982 [Coemansia sp. RSA 2559]|nr:hypothetical protein GGI23_003982 [Coemansia sp. RSA 2559]KAJ2858837.1 hypothetical protein GGI22_003202 [Coemansia erecta]